MADKFSSVQKVQDIFINMQAVFTISNAVTQLLTTFCVTNPEFAILFQESYDRHEEVII